MDKYLNFHVIASQCTHWRGNLLPADCIIRIPSDFYQMGFCLVALYLFLGQEQECCRNTQSCKGQDHRQS